MPKEKLKLSSFCGVLSKECADAIEKEMRETRKIPSELHKQKLAQNNPLKELFGFGRNNKITKEEFLETRKLLEGKSMFGKLKKVKEEFQREKIDRFNGQ